MEVQDVESLVKNLSPKEIGELIYDLDKDQYEEKPVDIETFIDSDEFLGGEGVFEKQFLPFWREELKKIYPTPFYSPFYEILALLPIGGGKTTTSLVSIAYEVYRLLCLKNPQNYHNLRPSTTQIVFTLFSVSKSLAEDTNWPVIHAFLKTPWFSNRSVLPVEGKLKSESSVILAKGISIELGSAAIHAIGKAVFGGVLDEANFQRVKSEQAGTSYNTILRRMESRFMKRGGVIPGKLWLVSSPKSASDFMASRIDESKKAKRTLVISNSPIWIIKPDDELSGETFSVFVGDDNRDPMMIDGAPPQSMDTNFIYDVPIEYKDSFEKDLISSIRDIIGLSTSGSTNLIRHVFKITKAAVIPHRFTAETFQLDFYDPKQRIEHYANKDYFKAPMHPAAMRFVHCDLAITQDKLGMGCVFGIEDKVLDRMEDENPVYRRERTYYNDWVLSVQAIPGQEIPLYKIRDWFLFLKEIGYRIDLITCDQFQSRDMRQLLTLAGFKTGYVSVDGENKEPYQALKGVIYAEKMLLSNHKLLQKELKELRDYGDRIDHLPQFSKDLSDGVAGAFHSCHKAPRLVALSRADLEVDKPKNPIKELLQMNSDRGYYQQMKKDIFPV